MANFRRINSSTIVLACLLPLALTSCGSSASSPAAGHSTASNSSGATTGSGSSTQASTGTATGTTTGITSTTPLGAAGNTVGTVVESTGTTVAATGASLTNDALNNPVGITVLNNSTPGTGAGNIVDANVLSNTLPSTAPVQANVLSNGQIVSASIATTQTPVVTPVVNGLTSTVTTIPVVAPALNTVTNDTQAAVTQVGAATSSATTPLNPLLNVELGKTTLIGAPGTKAAINADALTPSQIVNVAVTQPNAGPVSGPLNNNALTSAAGPLTNGLNTTVGGLTKGLGGNGLTGGLLK